MCFIIAYLTAHYNIDNMKNMHTSETNIMSSQQACYSKLINLINYKRLYQNN